MTSSRPSVCGRVLFCLIACLVLFQAGHTASQTAPEVAGLVVDYGNGTRTYALIPIGDESMNGIDLLEDSGLDMLTVGFGGMGVGVCAIETVGCDISACQGRLCQTSAADSPFWSYLRAPATAGEAWQFSSLGASATAVKAGDVNAWFWTGTRPAEAALSLNDIADQLDVALADIGNDAIVRTFGSLPNDEATRPSSTAFLASGLLLVGLGGAAIVAVRRARSS
jgi:hypothetical protein